MLFIPQLIFAADLPADVVKLQNPIGGTAKVPEGVVDVKILIGNVVKNAMGVLGSITLVVFVYGSFLWLTSAGKPDMIKKGTETMLWAAIGICVIFASYAILNFVMTSLSKGYTPTEESQDGGTKPIGAVKPKPTAKVQASNKCEEVLGDKGLTCSDSCLLSDDTQEGDITVGARFTPDGDIGKFFKAHFDEIALGLKKKPGLQKNYISNLCGANNQKTCCLAAPSLTNKCADIFGGPDMGLTCTDDPLPESSSAVQTIFTTKVKAAFDANKDKLNLGQSQDPEWHPNYISWLCGSEGGKQGQKKCALAFPPAPSNICGSTFGELIKDTPYKTTSCQKSSQCFSSADFYQLKQVLGNTYKNPVEQAAQTIFMDKTLNDLLAHWVDKQFGYKNPPGLEGNYISNVCSGSSVCCVKSSGTCVQNGTLPAMCSAQTTQDGCNGVENKVCYWNQGKCIPNNGYSQCDAINSESAAIKISDCAIAHSDFCIWKL